MTRALRFSTPEAKRCFEAINSASSGFDMPAIAEAASNLLAKAIAHGASGVDDAQERLILIATAIARDFEENWPKGRHRPRGAAVMSKLSRGYSLTKAPGASPSGDGGLESTTRSPLSPMLRALAAGLQRDAASQAAGWDAGKQGLPFLPGHHDPFSYACGFGAGRQLHTRAPGVPGSRQHEGGGHAL